MFLFVRVQIITVASMKTAFWDIPPCSLLEVYRRFRGAYSIMTIIAIRAIMVQMMEAVGTSETSVYFS
jgi:hypothetical protein